MSLRIIQEKLKAAGYDVGVVDGKWGPRTAAAVDALFAAAGHTAAAPAEVGGALTEADILEAAAELNVTPAHVRAVIDVESRGEGMDPATGLPIILYEPHVFHRETGGRFSAKHGGVSYAKWKTKPYPRTQAERWDQLRYAQKLDNAAALRSASWGLFQIMGFNHAECGFDTVEAFVDAMAEGEGAQLWAFVAYVKARGLDRALRRGDWATFAKAYNGPGYAQHGYHTKLAEAYRRHGGR